MWKRVMIGIYRKFSLVIAAIIVCTLIVSTSWIFIWPGCVNQINPKKLSCKISMTNQYAFWLVNVPRSSQSSLQGGGSWQNREILIFSTTTRAWTVINNEKPSPMYEMMSGAIYNDQVTDSENYNNLSVNFYHYMR